MSFFQRYKVPVSSLDGRKMRGRTFCWSRTICCPSWISDQCNIGGGKIFLWWIDLRIKESLKLLTGTYFLFTHSRKLFFYIPQWWTQIIHSLLLFWGLQRARTRCLRMKMRNGKFRLNTRKQLTMRVYLTAESQWKQWISRHLSHVRMAWTLKNTLNGTSWLRRWSSMWLRLFCLYFFFLAGSGLDGLIHGPHKSMGAF